MTPYKGERGEDKRPSFLVDVEERPFLGNETPAFSKKQKSGAQMCKIFPGETLRWSSLIRDRNKKLGSRLTKRPKIDLRALCERLVLVECGFQADGFGM